MGATGQAEVRFFFINAGSMAGGEGSNPSRTFQRSAISGKIIYVTPFYWYPEKFQWRNTCTAKQEGQARFLLLGFMKGWQVCYEIIF